MLRALCLALAVTLLGGCKSFSLFSSEDNPSVSYGDDADANLRKGDEALDSHNYAEAQKYYDFVRSKYPYLDAARTAELKLADVDFERDHFLEARDRYQSFIKLHPTHPKVDYAAFRVAMTFYKDIPSDYFFLPPAEEKDQANVRGANLALADFVRSYPDSSYKADADKYLKQIRIRLAEHELYVAHFYARRDKWPAVVARLSTVASQYGGLGFDEEVYFGLYDAYLKLNDGDRAKNALRALVEKAPDTKGAQRAKAMLGPNG
ncbi:MAG: outer membrane protein assembly factor BamD [Myxococcaceae bacterium]|nr:outer membrane protein assembly factor BamD [Myxococcaceae bacterium]